MDLSIKERMCFSTTRIETFDFLGNSYSGTGFFFNLLVDDKVVPLLVTNKHVVRGMKSGRFILTEKGDQDNPLYTQHFPIVLDDGFENYWISHPDDSIDLCVLPINPLIDTVYKRFGKSLFYMPFDSSLVPSNEQLNNIDVAEEVLMIGYPNGLWDSVNNMPIVRRGIMATNVSLNHNGKREFVIDAACFPGSSGSPVVLYNNGGYADKHGTVIFGQGRLYLLGVLYAGPQLTVAGDIKVVTVPNVQQKMMSVSQIPNNLGYIIKSEVILDFVPLVRNLLVPKKN